MLAKEFDFHAPAELDEALGLLAGAEGVVKVLAGGMSLVPAMSLGLVRPDRVVSLNHVRGLSEVEDGGDSIRLGAMVTHERIASDPLIARAVPSLATAASLIGDVQIRHRGTVGGSLAHADPAADYLPVMAVLGAALTLRSSDGGERRVAARDFFVDIMLTDLGRNELLVSVEVPKVPAGAGAAYVRLARVEGSFAIVNAAAVVDGRAAIAIGGATGAPVVVEPDVDPAAGKAALDEIGDAAYEAAEDAFGDLSASAEYRRELARVYARRAVQAALAARS
jgi:carbon-monoxide dehydrogenase medium subunit